MSQLNLLLYRPFDKATKSMEDTKEYATLTLEAIVKMTPSSLQTWSRENCNVLIKVLFTGDTSETKRLIYALSHMKVPRKPREEQAPKDLKLQELRKMLLCTDHTAAEGTPLYADVSVRHLTRASPIIAALLHPYQLEVLQNVQDDQVFNDNVIIHGPSGSGKTYLAVAASPAYLLPVKYKEDNHMIFAAEQEAHLAGGQGKGKGKEEELDTDGDAVADAQE
jgi:hypothetical protein